VSPAPPYSLAPALFRFRALATNAGRAPLGGARETGLACYVAARLAAGLLLPIVLTDEERVSRAAAARVWLASQAVPAPMRAPLVKLIDATRGSLRAQAGAALVTVAEAAASYLDGPALSELRALAAQLS
jgi:hypothetical protein